MSLPRGVLPVREINKIQLKRRTIESTARGWVDRQARYVTQYLLSMDRELRGTWCRRNSQFSVRA